MKTYNPKRTNAILVFDNDVNQALKKLKHETAQLLKEVKMKRYFESGSEKRRRKAKEAVARERTRQRKADMYL